MAYATEAEIQAELYHRCKLIGLAVRLEYSTPVGRLDVALMSPDHTRMLAIVECKKTPKKVGYNTKQLTKYRSIGVRVEVLDSMDAIPKILEFLKSASSEKGVGVSDIAAMKRHSRKDRKMDFDECLNIKR